MCLLIMYYEKEMTRVSIRLPVSILCKLDTLKHEWGVEGRNEALVRLLEQIFSDEEEDAES